MKTRRVFALNLVLLSILVLTSGCTYMQKRGHDAMDIIDIGIALPKGPKPQFGLYFDFFNILPLGYSHVEAKQIGMANRQAGYMDLEHTSWGVIGWGKEKKGSGEFDAFDAHQVRADLAGIEARPAYNVGIPRMSVEGDAPPPQQFFECDRIIYLGYIGIHATIRPFDILDFVLGWTTLDIMGDDEPLQPAAAQ